MANRSKNLYLHADGDAFFVACEISVHPELRGKPVIVGGDRGIAVAMSPEAKKIGVTRGMPVFKIKKLYPQVVILSHHFDLYRDIAHKMHDILASYFREVEQYSIDECFVLVRPAEVTYHGGEAALLHEIKHDIEKTLGVTYSFGLARTKALSKLASKLEKPNGLVMLLTKEDEIHALQKTSIDDIWGIGRQTIPHMKKLGLATAYDFANLPHSILEKFSAPLRILHKELNGEELLQVESNIDPRDQKSIQSTGTFHPASTDPKVIWREISEHVEHACIQARSLQLVTNKVSFFVKTSEFAYFSDEVKLEEYTSDPGVILNMIEERLLRLLPKNRRIRSTGVMLHHLTKEEETPRDLFGNQEKAINKLAIEEAADKIRKKFGTGAIKRLSSLKKKD
jgi:DNA polymerase-4/DNA polymerase V